MNVNGERFEPALEKGYMVINRRWQKGDTVTLDLHMRPEFLESHPGVKDNVGRVAIRRGPVVYCVEAEDNPGVDVWDLEIPKDTKISKEYRDTLGGIVAIKGEGYINEPGLWEKLYLPLDEANRLKEGIEFTAIPYYAWANRTPGPMEVWIKTK